MTKISTKTLALAGAAFLALAAHSASAQMLQWQIPTPTYQPFQSYQPPMPYNSVPPVQPYQAPPMQFWQAHPQPPQPVMVIPFSGGSTIR